jgi:hypothetical protein
MVYRSYKKSEIANMLLETALDLYFSRGDGFSIIHLAAAAEEVLSGLLNKKNENAIGPHYTTRERTISTLKEIHAIHDSERSRREISDFLNYVNNKTKHHNAVSDSDEITACLELEIDSVLSRAIENYFLYFETLTEKMLRYINHMS